MKKTTQQQVKVQYKETSSLFASQFLVNSTSEDVTIGFSSGYISSPGSQDTTLPIHTRIATTMEGAKRLHDLLGKVISQTENSSAEVAIPTSAKAKLPKL